MNAAAMGVAFASQILLARVMGVSEFGLYMYALAWVNSLVFIGKLGYDTVALRFVPQYLARGDFNSVGHFTRHAIRKSTSVSLVIMILVLGVTCGLKALGFVSNAMADVFVVASFTVPVFAGTLVVAGLVQARRQIILAQGLPNVVRPLLIAASAAGLFAAGIIVSSQVAMALTVAAAIGVLVVMMVSAPHSGDANSSPTSQVARAQWDAAAVSFTITTSFTLLLNQCDLQILGMFAPAESVGTYAAASRLAILVPFPTNAANSGLAPEVARLHSAGNTAGIRALIHSASFWTLAMSSALAGTLLVGGSQLLGLFGEEFRDGAPILAILVLARLMMAMTGLGGHLLNMTGNHASAARVVVIAASIQILACFVLVPAFGAYGAAGSALAGAAVWSFLTVRSCRRLLGLNPIALRP